MVAASATPEIPPVFTTLCGIFRRYLKTQSLRYTTERADVLAAVMQQKDLFDAETLLAEMLESGQDVSKATVYRTLRLLQDAGIVTPFMILGAKHTHYQLVYGREQSDYLVCVQTGELKAIDCDDIRAIRDRIAESHGWEVAGHRFVIYGIAPASESDSSR